MLFIQLNELIILGFTNANINKFEEGMPLYRKFHKEMTFDTILIVKGTDKIDLLKQLQGLGLTIEDYMWKSAEEDPT